MNFDAHIKWLNNQISTLQDELESLKRLSNSKAPCGHLAQYSYTDDGGKRIYCYRCQFEAIEKLYRVKDTMARIIGSAKLDLVLTFTISESEARALDGLAGYGDDAFITAFYERLGKSYMRDHEQGLRLFLKSIREFIPNQLRLIDDARKTLAGEKTNI